MKVCNHCHKEKPESDFYSAGVIDGKKYQRRQCKECWKKVAADRQKSLKQDYIEWKKTLKCNRCGFDDHRALQFHHERDKEHCIANMLQGGYALEKIKLEAEKCEVLCANCHQIHHSCL